MSTTTNNQHTIQTFEKTEVIYLSVDIERTGDTSENETIQFSVCAIDNNSNILGTYVCYPKELNKKPAQACLDRFWLKPEMKLKEVYENILKCREEDPRTISEQMNDFNKWLLKLKSVCKNIVFVCMPASYDHYFVRDMFLLHCTDKERFDYPFSARCLSTLKGLLEIQHGWPKLEEK